MKDFSIKSNAFTLRKQGKSFSEIASILQISKSTLSLWFRNETFSKNIGKRLSKISQTESRSRLIKLNQFRREKLLDTYQTERENARKEFLTLHKKPLFLIGIALYWGEGDKVFKNGQVRVSNVDPRVISIFYEFLYKICKIPKHKIYGHLLLYPDLSAKICLKFWSEHGRIPIEKFSKPVVIQGRSKRSKTKYGVCTVQVGNKRLKAKILEWIDILSESLHAEFVQW